MRIPRIGNVTLAAAVLTGLAAVPAFAQPATRPDAAARQREQRERAERDAEREWDEALPPGGVPGRRERLEKAAYLGIATSPASPPLRRQLGLPRGVGLVVDFIAAGSPAESAGFRQFDVLHKLDDQILVNPQQLAVLIRTHKAGDEPSFLVLRDGKPQTLAAGLIEKDLPPLEDLRLGMNEQGGPLPVAPDPLRLFDRPPRPGDPRFPAGRHEAGPGGLLDEAVQVVWDDGATELVVTCSPGEGGPGAGGKVVHRSLVARDHAGKVLFDGPIDTPEQWKAVPESVREKARHLPPALGVTPPPADAPATRPADAPAAPPPGK